jgi:hypothetical protein
MGFHVNYHVEDKIINEICVLAMKPWETNLVAMAICDGSFFKFHLW